MISIIDILVIIATSIIAILTSVTVIITKRYIKNKDKVVGIMNLKTKKPIIKSKEHYIYAAELKNSKPYFGELDALLKEGYDKSDDIKSLKAEAIRKIIKSQKINEVKKNKGIKKSTRIKTITIKKKNHDAIIK